VWGALAGFAVLLGSGCHRDELEEQRRRLAREHEERMAELERVEARLYHALGTVRLWQELGERHRQVSALACENLAAHAEAMERHHQRLLAPQSPLRGSPMLTRGRIRLPTEEGGRSRGPPGSFRSAPPPPRTRRAPCPARGSRI